MKKVFLAVFLILIAFPLFSQLSFSLNEIDFGYVDEGKVYSQKLTVSNNSDVSLNLTIIPNCECVTVSSESLSLSAGESDTISIILNTDNESGVLEKIISINTDSKNVRPAKFFVYASVTSLKTNNISGINWEQFNKNKNGIEGVLFYSSTCSSCINLINNVLSLYADQIFLILINTSEKNYDSAMLQKYMDKFNTRQIKSTVFITENSILQGNKSIVDNLQSVIVDKNSIVDGRDADPIIINVITSLSGGLIDGINPCAFATLIFFLSALTYVGKKTKEILIIGFVFTVTVFAVYFFIGLGLFQVMRLASSYYIIAQVIKWVVFSALIVFACLSIIDFITIKKGKTSKIILQLPKSLKKKIHTAIRTRIRSAALITTAITLGFLVTIFELGCTGQIYFPTISKLAQQDSNVTHIVYLLLYNIGFILPLLIVFVLSYFGLTSEKLSSYFSKKIGLIKLLTALFFIFLAILTISIK